MKMIENNDDNGEEGPLTLSETKRLRRMLQDDYYARRFKTTVKVWIITFGTAATMLVAFFTIWKEVAGRIWK